jgi:hypothetical protein
MEAVAHDPEVAKKTGIPQSVGKEFVNADSDEARSAVFERHFHSVIPEVLKSKNKAVEDHLIMHRMLSK